MTTKGSPTIKRKMYDKENLNKSNKCVKECGCAGQIIKLEETVNRQFEIIGRLLGEQKVMIGQLLKGHGATRKLELEFPIKNEEELAIVEDSIKNGDRDSYIQTMKMLLRPHGVIKNFKYILTDEMADSHNVDGILGKKSLKQYNCFYKAIIDSISFGEKGTPEEQLRKALQLQKKRVAKRK